MDFKSASKVNTLSDPITRRNVLAGTGAVVVAAAAPVVYVPVSTVSAASAATKSFADMSDTERHNLLLSMQDFHAPEPLMAPAREEIRSGNPTTIALLHKSSGPIVAG